MGGEGKEGKEAGRERGKKEREREREKVFIVSLQSQR